MSLLTTLMNVGANGARIVTSVREGLQFFVIVGFAISLALNVILLLQIVVYWRRGPPKAKPEWSMV